MTTRVLITGGTGLLGHALLQTAPPGWDITATYWANRPAQPGRWPFHHLDVQDEASVRRLLEALRPDVVIHTASVGSVEEAERQPDTVRAANVGGTQAVGRACGRIGARFVFISSNAVFDGQDAPYTEEDPVHAVNRYGALKIEAELWVRQRCPVPAAIVRPILLYGWPMPGRRGNVVTRWLGQLEQGHPVQVDASLWSMPMWAPNCAEVVWAVVRQGRIGIYHAAGADRLLLIEFARQVARAFGYALRLVQPASEQFLAQFAPRPKDTSFVTTKMQKELGVRPIGTREGLAAMHRTQQVSPLELRPCAS